MKTLANEVGLNDFGWLWPVDDTQTWHWLAEVEPEIPEWVMGFVPEKGVCVQAGGNCGLYVRAYANAFQAVHTFEPHATAFRCLVHNVPLDNVCFYRAALGETPGLVSLQSDPDHLGATQIVDEAGTIPVLELDSLHLPRVDLIHLDVEGYELRALAGARETLQRCRPVVGVEINGRCETFGASYDQIMLYMHALGYKHGGYYRNEHVFLPV